jgi:hypothetical protein
VRKMDLGKFSVEIVLLRSANGCIECEADIPAGDRVGLWKVPGRVDVAIYCMPCTVRSIERMQARLEARRRGVKDGLN